MGSVETNAETLKIKVLQILEKCKVEKVNIIAHSKGGIDARYMVSSLHLESKVASITTISTPHHGSKMLNIFGKFPLFIQKTSAFFVNLWFHILGDTAPAFLATVKSLNTKNMEEFNLQNLDQDAVFYQSYGFQMKHAFSDIFLFFNYMTLYLFEGSNDGVVSVKSCEWTNYKGPFYGVKRRGISHLDQVDFRRRNFSRKSEIKGINDIREFYKDIVSELQKMGF